jgi:hypothetical protein
MNDEVKKPEGENLYEVESMVIWFNKNYSIRKEDELKHFRRQGEKERVQAELRIFNGQPQLVVFYGKTRYTFNIFQRVQPNTAKALMRITGYKGMETIDKRALQKHFTETEVELRQLSLKERGY